jgi:hypothetical protein
MDRGKAGSKYHVLCDGNGLPLHALANTHDGRMLAPLLDTNRPSVNVPDGRDVRGGGRASCTLTRAVSGDDLLVKAGKGLPPTVFHSGVAVESRAPFASRSTQDRCPRHRDRGRLQPDRRSSQAQRGP